MNTAITNKRIAFIGRNYGFAQKQLIPSEPTPEDQARIAPVCNMLFALSMVLESLTIGRCESEYELACGIRSRVHQLVPSISEMFGDWAEMVETSLLAQDVNHTELVAWVIAKLYALNAELTVFYRAFDPDFLFIDDESVCKLKLGQGNFRKSTAAMLNSVVYKLMNA